MKRQIRKSVFETNSSSTHSLTICSKDEFKKFKNGEYLITWDDEFVSYEDVLKELKQDGYDVENINKEEVLEIAREEYEYYSYENYGEDYEYFEKVYETPNGDDIVAFGYYGYC